MTRKPKNRFDLFGCNARRATPRALRRKATQTSGRCHAARRNKPGSNSDGWGAAIQRAAANATKLSTPVPTAPMMTEAASTFCHGNSPANPPRVVATAAIRQTPGIHSAPAAGSSFPRRAAQATTTAIRKIKNAGF